MKIGRRLKGVCAVVAGLALTLGGAVSATAGTNHAEGQVTLADSPINEATLATLEELGFDLSVVPADGLVAVTLDADVDRERAAEVYAERAPFWTPDDSTEGEAGLSLRVMSEHNHDSGVITSPYEEGDWAGTGGFMSVKDGKYVTNGWSAYLEGNSRNFLKHIYAHTSYHEGGVSSGGVVPLRTWALDRFAQTPGEDFTAAREAAGAYSHNPATLSDATDGETTIVIQAFAIKGGLNEDHWDVDPQRTWEANMHEAIALTDGLELVLDTSGVDWEEVPVGEDGWAYQDIPNHYVYHIVNPIRAVSKLDERIEDNIRTRTAHNELWHFTNEPLELGNASIAGWQTPPAPVVPEYDEVRVGFFHNEDGTYGAVFRGEGVEDGFFLPVVYTQLDEYTWEVVLPVSGNPQLESGDWSSDAGVLFTWDQVSIDEGEMTVRIEADAQFAPAQGIPEFSVEDEVLAANPVSFWMITTSWANTYTLPLAADDYEKTEQDVPVDIWIHENDAVGTGGIEKTTAITQPKNGTIEELVLSFTDEDGVTHEDFVGYTYTPNAGFSGNDQFRYQYEDAEGYTAEATVFIEVTAVEAPPTTPPPSDPPVDPPADPPAPPVEPPTTPPAPPVEPPTSPPDTPDIPGRPDTGVVAPLATSADVEGSAAAEVSAAPDSTDVRSIVSGIAMGVGALLLAAGAVMLFIARNRNGFHRA